METHTHTEDPLGKTIECKVIDLAKTPKCPRCGGYRTKRSKKFAVCYGCDMTWLTGWDGLTDEECAQACYESPLRAYNEDCPSCRLWARCAARTDREEKVK